MSVYEWSAMFNVRLGNITDRYGGHNSYNSSESNE